MNKMGKILAYLYVIRVYKNGDTFGFVWRWWNPVSWVYAPLTFIVMSLFEGLPYVMENKHQAGFGMDPYFVKNRNQLEWLN